MSGGEVVESVHPDYRRIREALREFRVGSVPYLNAAPLTEGIDDLLTFDVPAGLARRFADGELDAALVPLYEAIALERATVADDIAIACAGEVFSVVVATRQPVESLTTIALDPDSRTSSHLLQCLFAEFFDQEIEFTERVTDSNAARLIIGDPAIEFRKRHSSDGWNYLDLGAEWMRRTELPFVFACWVFRPGLDDPERLAGLLREVKTRGLAERPAIAARSNDPDFNLRYLTDFVRFDLGAPEKRAIALFAALLRKHGLVASGSEGEIRYV